MIESKAKHFLIVANPRSGKGRALKLAEELSEILNNSSNTATIIATLGEELMLRMCEDFINASDCDGLFIVGGDGLLHSLLPLVHRYQIPFTMVPAGTGNDFAREIGATKRSLSQISALVDDFPIEIDSILIQGSHGSVRACQVLSLGFDALVNERANGFRRISGKLKYIAATIRELPVFKAMRFKLTIDGESSTREAMLIAIANGPSYGGGMRICPSADHSDGLLDVLILHQVSIFELIKVFPKVYSGKHITHPAVEVVRCRQITVDAPARAYADGEFVGELPLQISIEPRSLRVWK